VLVDVAGTSDETALSGWEIHFVANFSTRAVAFKVFPYVQRHKDQLLDWRFVGKLVNQQYPGSPDLWAVVLGRTADGNWFPTFTTQNGNTWNSQCNCQQFTRHVVQQMGFIWPSEWSVGDQIPVVVDMAVLFVSVVKAKATQ
jgi:hypothetical protein